MKLKFSLAFMFFLLLGFGVEAQEIIEKKKVKIIKETVDENGERKREVIEAEDDEADELLREYELEIEMSENDDLEDEDVIIKRIEINGDDIDWDGDEDIDVIIKELKDENGVHMRKNDKGREFMFPKRKRGNRFFMDNDEFVNNNKASLGVIIEDTDQGVIIEDFVENSGAKNAGLRRGDVILKVDKKYIFSDVGLVEALSPYDPGEKIKVKVLRDGKEKTKKVKLSRRD